MSSVNASTGYTQFHLHLGRSPRLLPPLTPKAVQDARLDFPTNVTNALEAIMNLKTDVADAHDALVAAKISQASTANTKRNDEPELKIDDLVYLSTAHRRQEYLHGSNRRVAK
ncbi:uncharacterized protein HD556DRAFT_1214787, partial [Suillus plorans]